MDVCSVLTPSVVTVTVDREEVEKEEGAACDDDDDDDGGGGGAREGWRRGGGGCRIDESAGIDTGCSCFTSVVAGDIQSSKRQLCGRIIICARITKSATSKTTLFKEKGATVAAVIMQMAPKKPWRGGGGGEEGRERDWGTFETDLQ